MTGAAAQTRGDFSRPEAVGLAVALLARLTEDGWVEREGAHSALAALTRLRWPWAAAVARHLAPPARTERGLFARLPEWDETAPPPPPRPEGRRRAAGAASLLLWRRAVGAKVAVCFALGIF